MKSALSDRMKEYERASEVRLARLMTAFVAYDRGMPKQIQHALKVYEFSRLIAEGEGLDAQTRFTLESAAVIHDIGIRESLRRYGDSSGLHQQELGPDIAREMLSSLGYDAPVVERIAYLIAHHHTYGNIDGLDYQILVEADFLVNLFEDESPRSVMESVRAKIFRTKTGLRLLDTMFDMER